MVFAKFRKIDVIEQIPKNIEFWLHFRRPKRRKFDETWYAKILFFSTSNFQGFFSDFRKFCSIWGGSGASKIEKNRKKSRSGRVWNSFEIKNDFGSDFRRILDGFFEILDGFRKDFSKFLGRLSNDCKHFRLQNLL